MMIRGILSLTPNSIPIPVKSVRVRRQDFESAVRDFPTVYVRRVWRDADRRVGRSTICTRCGRLGWGLCWGRPSAGPPQAFLSLRPSDPTAVVRATLTLTNVSQAAVVTTRCPVLIYAFLDRARRDAAFPLGEPDWPPSERCYLDMDKFTLSSG
jgi:hypothetical protein